MLLVGQLTMAAMLSMDHWKWPYNSKGEGVQGWGQHTTHLKSFTVLPTDSVSYWRAHLSFWCFSGRENGGTETWKVIVAFLWIKRVLRPMHLLKVGRSGHGHIKREQVFKRLRTHSLGGMCRQCNLGVLLNLRLCGSITSRWRRIQKSRSKWLRHCKWISLNDVCTTT